MVNSRDMMFVFALCVCVLTMSTAAEDLNIQPLHDESDGRDTSPSSMVETFASRLLQDFTSISEVVSRPNGIFHKIWQYYGEFVMDFTSHNMEEENLGKVKDETLIDKHAQYTGSVKEYVKETNATTLNRSFVCSMSRYAKHSIQLIVAALTLYVGHRICAYAVTYMHAQRARYLSQSYDVQRDKCRQTESKTLGSLSCGKLISRFVCYDDQSAAWRDLARRLSPHGNHDGEQRQHMDGLNLITDIGRTNQVDDEIGQTHEDLGNRNQEKEQIRQIDVEQRNDKETDEMPDPKKNILYETYETNGSERHQVTDEEAAQLVDERLEGDSHNIQQRQINQTNSNQRVYRGAAYRHDIRHTRSAAKDDTNQMFVLGVNQSESPSMSGSSQPCNPKALGAKLGRV